MTTTEVLPDVDIDESALTQQPCTLKTLLPSGRILQCGKPAVGEDFWRSADGHSGWAPHCAAHIAEETWNRCGVCRQRMPVWLIVSRYYRSAS